VGVIKRAALALRRNWLMALIFAAGLGLRVLTVVAYRPAIIYVDSIYIYLNHLPGSALPFGSTAAPDPLGYNMFLLQPALAFGNLLTVTVIQHLLGLAMAVAIYAMASGDGPRRWPPPRSCSMRISSRSSTTSCPTRSSRRC
jgi:predicted cobalt transporter CbtA